MHGESKKNDIFAASSTNKYSTHDYPFHKVFQKIIRHRVQVRLVTNIRNNRISDYRGRVSHRIITIVFHLLAFRTTGGKHHCQTEAEKGDDIGFCHGC